MNRKRIGVIMMVVGILLALGVGVFVYNEMEQAREIENRTPTVDVVVARADLPERAPISASSVGMAKLPADVVPVEAITRSRDVVGKYPLQRIYKSEVLIGSKLADTAGKAGPAFSLKEGMVAITYAGTENLSAAGALRPGDKVDMLLSLPLPKQPAAGGAPPPLPTVSQTLLQNIEVLRVGGFPSAGPDGAPAPQTRSVTFEVSHQDALILKWAKDSGGVVDLVLRHPADDKQVETDAITANYIFRKYRFTLAEPLQ